MSARLAALALAVLASCTPVNAQDDLPPGTPLEAFFVQCDDENNPPEAVARGEVVATIGLAVASPAEFIVLKVKRTPDAVSVAEEAV